MPDMGMAMDDDEFRALFERDFGDVWRFLRRRCASADVADDLAAETFAVAWRRREQVPEGDASRLWLFGVARRVAANHVRGEQRRVRLIERLKGTRAVPHVVPESDRGLAEALATLRPAERELLVLAAWDGLPVKDIAVLLETTPNAVSLRLFKARRRLEAALGKERGATGTSTARPPLMEGDAP